MKAPPIPAENPRKTEIKLPPLAPPHTKTTASPKYPVSYCRSTIYTIKLKTKTKNFDYFSKSCFQILVFEKRQVKVSEKKNQSLEKVVKELRGTHSQLLY